MKKMHNLSQIASSKFTFSVLEACAAALATASASAYAMVSSRRCGSHCSRCVLVVVEKVVQEEKDKVEKEKEEKEKEESAN